jgi:hypothetical protein
MQGSALTGTLSGRGNYSNGTRVLETGDDTAGRVQIFLTGTPGANGTFTGSFDGTIRLENAFGDGGPHQVCGGTWTLRPSGS